MKKILIALVAIIIVAGGILFAIHLSNPSIPPTPTPTPMPTDVPKSLGESVVVEAVPCTNITDNKKITGRYPRITSFKYKEFENSINKQIASNIISYIAEINYLVDDETPITKTYKYNVDYKKYAYGNYLTLVVEQDYQTDGIRSNTWKDMYNIDASKERIIYLEDLFDPGVDFERFILEEILDQASLKGWKLMDGEGLTRLPKTQKFYIQDSKLVIYFDPSEIAATKYGALEFEMPFLLNEAGHFEIK